MTMDSAWKQMLWRQYAAAIDMLENAIAACPDDLWGDRERRPEFWYIAYHTLFFLDLYSYGTVDGWAPPQPFNLDEIDPAGVLPPRVYTRDELLAYLQVGRGRARAAVEALTDHTAGRRSGIPWLELSEGELILDSMRHVQHHTAQLNLILRQVTDSAPRWVSSSRRDG
ncbi:DinB family protein [Longimicrobium sp.]|uniref:DinB family protein n=1 Tax=Longimicrobium sp. TaxID=2029185 RepID=UPI003B3B07C8